MIVVVVMVVMVVVVEGKFPCCFFLFLGQVGEQAFVGKIEGVGIRPVEMNEFL